MGTAGAFPGASVWGSQSGCPWPWHLRRRTRRSPSKPGRFSLVGLPILLVSSCGSSTPDAGGGGSGNSATGGSGAAAVNIAGSGGGLGVAVRTSLAPLFPWTPSGGFDTASWPWGQCTWFVVYQGHAAGDHRVTWSGNADSWYANARAQGVPTQPAATAPEPGWIAVYAPGHGSDPDLGHVAVVVGVQASTDLYTIAEMNVLGLGVADLRTLRLDGTSPLLEGWIQ